ncbi:MAG: filamentous hemagglutinin N-terminal domain-containing protein [Cyanobacteria bacterium P01_G01_bin.19]
MKQVISPVFQVGIYAIGYLSATTSATLAQVTSDGTVNTQVNQNVNVAEITGGETRGGNLFHSFQDFSVPTGNEAFFNNANDISNIFSRVTGGSISNIDGLIRANGSASLFLINPAGIIFGENARLDIGGSFYGSTASSILFEDGEFGAVDNLQEPILTVNAPIGLGFRDNPEDIINRSVAGGVVENLEFARPDFEIPQIPVGLQVKPGQDISLIGGEIKLENGNIYAPGGKVELGGLSEAGVVSISNDGSFNFPENITRSDVSLTNNQQQEYGSIVNVAGNGGGSIKVHGRNLELSGRSFFFGGIKESSNTPNVQAGDFEIDVTENIVLNMSRITNIVSSGAEGNSGNINIKTKNLSIFTPIESTGRKDAGNISTNIFGTGNGGNITINASEQIFLLEEGNQTFGSIQTTIEPDSIGSAGDLTINTGSLLINGRNSVRSQTHGRGDAGDVTINASEQISLQGQFISNNRRLTTGITSQSRNDAEGNGGLITINTPFLSLSDHSQITASAQRDNQAGDVRITAGDIILRNTSQITTGTGGAGGVGNGGNLFIDARFIVAFPEQNPDVLDFPNIGISADATRGNGGNIDITAKGIFGIKEREREPGVNFISASSEFGVDGTTSISILDINPTQGVTELPNNVVESEETTQQACEANREAAAKNNLAISGKGGIIPEPGLPLNSLNVYVNGESTSATATPIPIETSQGKIQPARGVRVTESRGVILTAYRTNNAGERISKGSRNCGQV